MKVIQASNHSKPYQFTCKCGAVLEIEQGDAVYKSNGAAIFKCPVCSSETLVRLGWLLFKSEMGKEINQC